MRARQLSRTPGFKIFLIMGLTFLMCVPLFMISLTLSERQARARDAARDIESGWGQEQSISGIYLFVPYEVTTAEQQNQQTVNRRERKIAVLLPTRADISGVVRTEPRSRGIYDVTVYTAYLTINANFEQPGLAASVPTGATILWGDSMAVIGLSDARGLQQTATLSLDGRSINFAPGPGPGVNKLRFASIHAPLALAGAPGALDLQTRLTIRGSSELTFLPIGNDTLVRVQSPWPDPSFFGSFLPNVRQIDRNGFEASWSIPYLARGFGQEFADPNELAAISNTQFGVRFYHPVDFYQLVARSLKYAVLFVGLAFLVFFVVELLTEARLHAAQYALIGAAQVLFYLLLLSIAEHLGFNLAYMIGAAATIGLTTAYGASVFGTRRRAAILFVTLTVLYTALYSLLRVEDYALLLGSLLLFVTLALTMYLTRNLNWHQGAVLSGDSA